jgi:hypothetical protein
MQNYELELLALEQRKLEILEQQHLQQQQNQAFAEDVGQRVIGKLLARSLFNALFR